MMWQLRQRMKPPADEGLLLVQVTAPHFIADLRFDGPRCVEAPARLSAAVGRSAIELHDYFQRRGWAADLLR